MADHLINPSYDPANRFQGPEAYEDGYKGPVGDDVSWEDYGRSLISGVTSLGSTVAAAGQGLAEEAGANNVADIADYLRTTLGIGTEEAQEGMSEDAQRQLHSAVTSEDFWAHPMLASELKLANMTPTLAASMAPALFTGGATATGLIGAFGGVLGAGASAEDIYKQTEDKSDEDLRKTVPLYDGMRQQGRSEEDARRELNKELMKFVPAANAVANAVAMVLGPAGKVAGLSAGAGKGLLGRAAYGAGEAAVGGALMGGAGEAGHEQTAIDLGSTKGFDPAAIMTAGGESALEMAPLGAVGGVFHGGPEQLDAKSPDAAQLAALKALKGKEQALPPPPADKPAAVNPEGSTAAAPRGGAPEGPATINPEGATAAAPRGGAPEAPPVTPTGNAPAPTDTGVPGGVQFPPMTPEQTAARAQELAAKLPQTDQPAAAPAGSPADVAARAQELAAKLPQVDTPQTRADIARDDSGALTEAKPTLDVQQQELVNDQHPRQAIFYPDTPRVAGRGAKGTDKGQRAQPAKSTAPEVPVHPSEAGKNLPPEKSRIKAIRHDGGWWHYDSAKVKPKDLYEAVKESKAPGGGQKLGKILGGMGPGRETVAKSLEKGSEPVTVVSRTGDGVETKTATSSVEHAAETKKALEASEPVGGTTNFELPANVAAGRIDGTGQSGKPLEQLKAEAEAIRQKYNLTQEGKLKTDEAAPAEKKGKKFTKAARKAEAAEKVSKAQQKVEDEVAAERAKRAVLYEKVKGTDRAPQVKDEAGKNRPATLEEYQARGEAQIREAAAKAKPQREVGTKAKADKTAEPKGRVRGVEELTERSTNNESANEVADAHQPTEAEVKARSRPELVKPLLLARVKAMVQHALSMGEGKFKFPGAIKDSVDKNFEHSNATIILKEARKLDKAGSKATREQLETFMTRELLLREGTPKDRAEILEDIRKENDAIFQRTGKNPDDAAITPDVVQSKAGETKATEVAADTSEGKFDPEMIENVVMGTDKKGTFQAVTKRKFPKPQRMGGGEAPELAPHELQGVEVLQTLNLNKWLARQDAAHPVRVYKKGPFEFISKRITRILRDKFGDTKIHIIDAKDMKRIGGTYPDGSTVPGFAYMHPDGRTTIYISDAALAHSPEYARHLVTHEGIHAALVHAMHRDPKLYRIADQMMREMADALGEVHGDDARIYGFRNAHEFMAEVLSNQDFMDKAGTTIASKDLVNKLALNKISTLKDAFVEFVRKVLGLGKRPEDMSTLEAALHTFQHITGEAARVEHTVDPLVMFGPTPERSAINEAFHERFTDALERGGKDAKDFVQGFTQKGKAVESAVRAARTTGEVGKAILNKFTSLGQIVGANEHDMPHLRGIFEANERTGVISRDLQEKGTDLAGMEIRAQKQNPALFERFTNLLQRETLAGADASTPLGEGRNRHLALSKKVQARLAKGESMWDLEPEVAASAWRGRHAHADLKKEYDAIVAEDPRYAMMHEEHQKFYSEAQAAEREDLVNHIVDTFGFRGTDAERADAVEKVMNGTLNKDEQAELATRLGKDDSGGVEAVKALMGTRALRRVKGPYEPQMRRGEHAVVGTYKIKEPTNGTKIDDNTFEFKTRKEAHRFAVDSGLDFDEKHVYYDTATGKRVKSAVEAESTAGSAEQRFQVKLQRQHLSFHENLNDARAELTDMGNSGNMENIALEERQNLLGANSNLDTRGIKALLKSLEQQDRYKNASKNERKVLRNSIEEAGLRNLTGNRVQSRRIQRKGVYGGSTDSIRNLIDYNISQANFRARMKTRGEINKGIEAMRADNKARRYDGDVDAALRRSQVANEIEKRVMDPDLDEGTGRWSRASRRISTWSYIDRMLRASHLILHQMHLPMITSPYMAGRHGVMPAYAETMKAWHQLTSFYKAGGHDAWAATVGSALQKGTDYGALHDLLTKDAPDAARLKDMHKTLADIGYTHPSAGIEVSKFQPSNQLGGPLGALDRGLQKADTIFRGATNATEAINRMAGADAAYRLEFRKLTREGKSEADAHKLAVEYTKKVIHDTQGVFSNTNAAPIFQNKVLKPFLQFKQFPQMMYHLLGSLTKTALSGDTPKLERMQAIKSLAGILTTHALMAGAVMGTPQEPLKILVTVAHGLGLTDKDWTDFENAERGAIKSALGEEAGRIFINGLGAEVFGVDVRHRLGMGSLLTWGMPSDLDSKSASEFLVNAVAGAPGSLALDALKGTNKMLNGDLEGGALQAFPLQALRDARNAIAPPKKKYDYTPSAIDPLKSLLGFTPAKKAEAIEAQNAVYEGTHKYQAERTAFSKQWVGASPAQRDSVWQEIEAWNAGKPEASKLTKGDLFKAQHAANRSVSYNRVIGGVTTTPHTKGIAQGLVDLYQ